MIKLDLHVHSFYSPCSLLRFGQIASECLKKQIGGIAITDHDRIDGALSFKKKFLIPTIVGEEISTREGHLIGLFLTEQIPKGIPLDQAIKAIKAQGGLVYLPHPFDWTRHGLSRENVTQIQSEIDIIEVFNSRTYLPLIERRAHSFGEAHQPQVAASDAHSATEIGRGLVAVDHFPQSPSDLTKLLKKGRTIKKKKTPFYQRSLSTCEAQVLHHLGLSPKL